MVQAFRILDPKGILLETLSEPIKEVGTVCVFVGGCANPAAA